MAHADPLVVGTRFRRRDRPGDSGFPPELSRLLEAPDGEARTSAWERLAEVHSPLIIRVSRALGGGRDEAMDRYAFVLERLRQDDFRRLRAYNPGPGASFPAWLAVVCRRLCLDHYRERYGRPRTSDPMVLEAHQRRRRLEQLQGVDSEVAQVADPSIPDPADLIQADRDGSALQRALGLLPAEDRLLLRLRFEDNLSAREIAGMLDLPTLFHVYRRLNAVLRAMRARLAGEGVDGAAS